MVVGLEADIQGTDEKGSRSFTCPTGICTPAIGFPLALVIPGPAVPVTLNQKIDWFGTVRGRIGYLVDPKVLLYATGGLAYGEVDSSATIGLVPTGFGTVSNTHVGWTVGAGIEGVIGGNWTASLEYLYVDLGRVNGSFQTAIGGLGGGVLSSNYSRASPTTSCASASTTSSADRWWRSTERRPLRFEQAKARRFAGLFCWL